MGEYFFYVLVDGDGNVVASFNPQHGFGGLKWGEFIGSHAGEQMLQLLRDKFTPYNCVWGTISDYGFMDIHIGLVSVRLGTTVRRCDQRRGPMDSQSYQRVHTTYYIAYIINPTSKMYVTTSPTHIPTRIHTVRPLHRRHSNHERTAIGTIERHNRRCATRDSCTPAQERMDCT